ncbi:MAG TPA: hypothetical protein VGE15_00695 [Sphingobacteriaceae bacterium]
MNNLKGKKLDEYFRQELTRQEQPFEEYHWLVLEKRLKKNRRNRIITWFISSGLAAMLLITLGISFLMNQDAEVPVHAKKSPSKDSPVQAGPAVQEPFSGTSADRPLASAGSASGRPAGSRFRPAVPGTVPVFYKREPAAAQDILTETAMLPAAEPRKTVSLAHGFRERLPKGTAVIALPAGGLAPSNLLAAQKQPEEKPMPDTGRPFKSSLSFSVFAGPDINGVNNLKNTGRGTSAGIALTYHVLPRLSISTGIGYAKKLYSTDFSNYRPNTSYTFPTNPTMVDADCRVLDIPLNLNYTVWQKKTNAIGISAGMSSYLMLREDYDYEYGYSYGGKPGPGHYGVKNQNRHYLGVMNLGVEYQKKLGKELSIGISPYVKLPVTDIGYGNVKLESAGITTSLNFNLRGLKSENK